MCLFLQNGACGSSKVNIGSSKVNIGSSKVNIGSSKVNIGSSKVTTPPGSSKNTTTRNHYESMEIPTSHRPCVSFPCFISQYLVTMSSDLVFNMIWGES